MNKKEMIAYWRLRISQDPKWAFRAARRTYNQQTQEEKNQQATLESNGVGFNSVDSPIITSILRYYYQQGIITSKQLLVLQRIMPKYATQLYKLVNKEKI